MQSVPFFIIILIASLTTGCMPKSATSEKITQLFADVQAGKYNRVEALQHFSAIPKNNSLPVVTPYIDSREQLINQLEQRLFLQIAEQELSAIQKSNPPLAALIKARCYGVVARYDGFESSLGVIKTLEEFDGIVKQAEADIALTNGKLGPTATIKVSDSTVKIVLTTRATNLNGTLVETTTEKSFPLDWVNLYAPALIQDTSKKP